VVTNDEGLSGWYALLRGRLSPGERVELPVLSGSMAPQLPIGSRLRVEAAGARDSGPGDIIVFSDGHSLTAHRVLLVLRLPRRCLVYQKGDANPRGAWIDSRRIVGRVVNGDRPDGGRADFDSSGARREARRLAWRFLRWDVKGRLFGSALSAPAASPAARAVGPAPAPTGLLLPLATIPRPRGCVLRELDGDDVLVDGAGGVLHILDGPGALIWRALDGHRSLAALADLVCAEYEVSPGEAAADLVQFMETLVRKGAVSLVVPEREA
jgi:hypothetical protein